MKELNGEMLHRLSVIKDEYPNDIFQLYESALTNTALDWADYLTIRDLVNINGTSPHALHALLLCMFSLLEEGSLCLSLERESLTSRLRSFSDDAEKIADEILHKLNDWPELLYCEKEETAAQPWREQFKPLVLSADKKRLYFQKYYHYEELFRQQIGRFMQYNVMHEYHWHDLKRMLYSILVKKPLYFNREPAIMNSEQVLALVLPLLKNLVIISGGPGTGKTSIVLNILRLFTRRGVQPDKIVLAAPTGRAAQRLTDSLVNGLSSLEEPDREDAALESVQGMTIHRLLQYSPQKNEFLRNEYNRIDADLVIVDEVSMIDLVLLVKLLQAIDEKSTVVLLGDRNQLPSVGAGAVLTDLMPGEEALGYSSNTVQIIYELIPGETGILDGMVVEDDDMLADRFVLLKKSFRSEKGILDVAEKINQQDIDVHEYIPPCRYADELPLYGICRIIPPASPDQRTEHFENMLVRWINEMFMKKDSTGLDFNDLVTKAGDYDPETCGEPFFESLLKNIFKSIMASRILSPVKSGRYGTIWINRYINSFIAAKIDPFTQTKNYFHGCPIILTRNDYKKDLFNGDMGMVLKSKQGAYYAFFLRPHGFNFYPVNSLDDFEPAWAITVHKSQGSEYHRVLIVVDENAGRLLTKEILYTGITRARSLAVIYGPDEALIQAVSTRIERVSGIALAESDIKEKNIDKTVR